MPLAIEVSEGGAEYKKQRLHLREWTNANKDLLTTKEIQVLLKTHGESLPAVLFGELAGLVEWQRVSEIRITEGTYLPSRSSSSRNEGCGRAGEVLGALVRRDNEVRNSPGRLHSPTTNHQSRNLHADAIKVFRVP